MLDIETESLWSHILGRAMKGELKGKRLESVASDMVTWAAWKRDHPTTTVLALTRTKHRSYTSDFYTNPSKFVVGLAADGARHCSFATLMRHPLVNFECGEPLVISYDPVSTSARIFSREIAERVLTFEQSRGGFRDTETGSTWNRVTGIATDGPLKGSQLKAIVGIVSYAKVWSEFHPDSREIKPRGASNSARR